MNRLRIELALGTVALLLCVVAARRTRGALAPPEQPAAVLPAAAALPPRFDFDWLGAAAEATVNADPFRLANAPASVRFTLAGAARTTGAPAPPSPPPAPRPVLAVKAIIGGPPWQAVIDGLGGQPGTVVRAGDTFDKLVVARITADSVIVRAPDTTWTLTFKRGTP
jgi:hypothetical protein